MNKAFKEEFYKRGYEELKDFYDIDSYDAKHKIKAFKQIDFLKEKVLVEVQFGKYAFMFYDLAPQGSLMVNNLFTILSDFREISPAFL